MAINPRIKPIERATSRTWDEWLKFMEGINAKNLTHHEIATRLLQELSGKIDNIGWWAQAIAVAYEQYIGRRIPGQRPDGTFQTSVSKSTKLGMKPLMDKWVAFATKDQDVLSIIASDEPRVSGTERRVTWRAKAKDGSSIVVISEPKSGDSAAIVVQHMGLQTSELSNEAKTKWSSILQRFLASF